jgi:hypothetical protein
MTQLLQARMLRRRQTMHFWYCFYLLGAFAASVMALAFTDACSALIIGTLSFWLTVSTFITYPALLRSSQNIADRAMRSATVIGGVLTIWFVSAAIILSAIVTVPMFLDAFAEIGLFAGRAGVASLVILPMLMHGALILLTEDSGYLAVSRCISEAHLPKSFEHIAMLVDFCEARDLNDEADLISKTTLALAEHGYFSKAA